MDSKAPSISNSCGNIIYVPSYHPYHRYQSLVTYITTFIGQVRHNVTDLKETLYELVGVQMSPSQESDCHVICSTDSCEIENLMKECRRLREDVVKSTAMLRGYKLGRIVNEDLTVVSEKINLEATSVGSENPDEKHWTERDETVARIRQRSARLNNQSESLLCGKISKLSSHSAQQGSRSKQKHVTFGHLDQPLLPAHNGQPFLPAHNGQPLNKNDDQPLNKNDGQPLNKNDGQPPGVNKKEMRGTPGASGSVDEDLSHALHLINLLQEELQGEDSNRVRTQRPLSLRHPSHSKNNTA